MLKIKMKEQISQHQNKWALITMWTLLLIIVIGEIMTEVKTTDFVGLVLIGLIPNAVFTLLHMTNKGVYSLKYGIMTALMGLCFFLVYTEPSIYPISLVFIVIVFTTIYADKWLLLYTSIPSIAYTVTLWMTKKEKLISSLGNTENQYYSLMEGVIFVILVLLIHTRISSFSNQMINQSIQDTEQERERINMLLNRVRKSTNAIIEYSEFLFEQLQDTLKITEKMNISFEDIEKLIEHQSQSTFTIQEATNALHGRVKHSADMMKRLRAIGQQTTANTNEGNAKVHAFETRMKELSETMNLTMNVMDDLKNKSQKMTEIISQIEKISNQTNLLSLNELIDSARMTDQSKGFSMVATEIRRLTEQEGKAMKEVSQLLNEVSNLTKLVNQRIGEGNDLLSQSLHTTDDVTNVFGSISNQVDDLFFSIQALEEELDELLSESQIVLEHVDTVAVTNTEHSSNTDEAFRVLEEQSKLIEETFENHKEMKKYINDLKIL